MDWFEDLFGFAEGSARDVRAALRCDGGWLENRATGRRLRAGEMSHPTLDALRERRGAGCAGPPGRLRLGEVVGDVRELHRDPANAGAVFQVASQFNLLEMIGPEVTPEQGITGYAHDMTQGPACAMACAAGTALRAYFVNAGGPGPGQSARFQLDGLDALGAALDNRGGRFWQMRNGYAMATRAGLKTVAQAVAAGQADRLRGRIKVGLQSGTQVTLPGAGHLVHQVYCSALPVAYGDIPAAEWEAFARLVLEADYEATVLAALAIAPDRPLFLTLLGGGAFANPPEWIVQAMGRALEMFADQALDVRVVSHGAPQPELRGLLQRFGQGPGHLTHAGVAPVPGGEQ